MIVGAWLYEGTRSLRRPMLRIHDLSHMLQALIMALTLLASRSFFTRLFSASAARPFAFSAVLPTVVCLPWHVGER
jgi:hypothetical protein